MQTLMATNMMFVLLATMITQPLKYLIASEDDLSDLWHRRYGHVNNKILKTLESKQLYRTSSAQSHKQNMHNVSSW